MNKCDFCEKMKPNGKCFWDLHAARETDCKRAIKKMMKVMKHKNKK